MKNILYFEYFATGEGMTVEIFFHNNMSDEKAVEKWKSEHDPYFHVGLEVISLENAEKNEDMVKTIKLHCPLLFNWITARDEKRAPGFKVDYKGYYNYS